MTGNRCAGLNIDASSTSAAGDAVITISIISNNYFGGASLWEMDSGDRGLIFDSTITGNRFSSTWSMRNNDTVTGTGSLIGGTSMTGNVVDGAVNITSNENMSGALVGLTSISGNSFNDALNIFHDTLVTGAGFLTANATISNNLIDSCTIGRAESSYPANINGLSVIGNMFANALTINVDSYVQLTNVLILGNIGTTNSSFVVSNTAAGNLTIPTTAANIGIVVAFNRFNTWTNLVGVSGVALMWSDTTVLTNADASSQTVPSQGQTVNWDNIA